MALAINTNVSALNAHMNMKKTDNALSSSLGRLSTGLRINKAADDASGMAIADSLKAQSNGLGQAIRNANDGINIVQTADGALDEAINIVNTIKTKAIQAAQDGQTYDSRKIIQEDINKLLEEVDLLASSTSFNGKKLLSGEFTNKSFQVGASTGEIAKVSIDSAETTKTGHVTTSDMKLNGTGELALTIHSNTENKDYTLQAVDLQYSNSSENGAGALADVINKMSDQLGITAQAVVETTSQGSVAAGSIADDFKINGVEIGAVTVQENDADGALAKAINGKSDQTGVTASVTADGQISLNSTDGRAIQIEGDVKDVTGKTAADMSTLGEIKLTQFGSNSLLVKDSDSGEEINFSLTTTGTTTVGNEMLLTAGSTIISGSTLNEGSTVGYDFTTQATAKTTADSTVTAGSTLLSGSSIESGTTLGGDTTVTATTLTKDAVLAKGSTIESGSTLAAGTQITTDITNASGITISAGTILNVDTVIQGDVLLQEDMTVKGSTDANATTILLSGSIAAVGSTINDDITLAGDSTISSDFTLKKDSSIQSGSILAEGSTLGADLVSAGVATTNKDTIVAAGSSLSSATVLNIGSTIGGSMTLEAVSATTDDLVLAAGSTIESGSTIAAGTYLTTGVNTANGIIGPGETLEQNIVVEGDLYLTEDMTLQEGSILVSGSIAKSTGGGTASDISLENTEVTRLSDVDVTSQEGAQVAIAVADSALKDYDKIRANLGSVQNQLTSTISNISTTQVNVKAAESTIRDVDFAGESQTFSKLQILAQSGSYAMSQANASSQNVMSLLQ